GVSVHTKSLFPVCLVFLALAVAGPALAQGNDVQRMASADLFDLQYASEVRISPSGEEVVYARSIHDIMCDCVRANLWLLSRDGSEHRPLLSGRNSYSLPRWSPEGERLAYVAQDKNGQAQLFVRWMDSGQTALVTSLTRTPASIAWGPDGKFIAFTMQVPAEKPSLAKAPDKPDGAEWAEPPVLIDSVVYRFDGRGYLDPGFKHVFIAPAEGGAARQLTTGDFNHHGPLAWMPDGSGIVFASNRSAQWQYELNERDLFRVSVEGGAIEQLTDLPGIASAPAVSPDGRT